MSRLRIFTGTEPRKPELDTTDHVEIARALAPIGVRFERWATQQQIKPGAKPERGSSPPPPPKRSSAPMNQGAARRLSGRGR